MKESYRQHEGIVGQPKEAEPRRSGENETILERIRRAFREYPPLRPITLSLGIMAGSIGVHFWEQGTIREDLLRQREQVEAKLQEEKSRDAALQEKYDQLEKLFGDYSPFRAGEDVGEAEQELRGIESRLKSFSWFEGAGEESPINQWSIRMREKIASWTEKRPKVETAADSLDVSAIETVEGSLGKAKFRHEMRESFPKGWLDDEVESISQIPLRRDTDDQYGLGKGWETAAYCADGATHGKSQIVLLGVTKEKGISNLITRILPHELGHANDWENDSQLSPEERVALLLAVNNRVQSAERYMSYYVESIRNKEPELERYLKAKEYWAEICQAYFDNPEHMDIHDFQLVDRVVKKSDPQFSFEKSINQRVRLACDMLEHFAETTPSHTR